MRVLLIHPPSPEQLGSPLLGLQYVAASLLAHGCEVRVIDAAARYFPHDSDWIVNEAHSFAPQIVGVSLFTRWVWHAYGLVERLRGGPWLLVSGGAHTTVRPEETLDAGFDIALTGEAELALTRVVDWVKGKDELGSIPGSVFRQTDGSIGYGPPSKFVETLDELPPPYFAQSLFDPRWYDPSGRQTAPGGILTSRGCPARCTFCANVVTGRSFRHRSAENVTAEINAWHEQCGIDHFPIWDDAFTSNPSRLIELCAAMERDLRFPFSFGAITRANMVTRELLRAMRRAGLVHVNFGVESGDDEILKAIKKGVRTDHVVRALEWAKEEGLTTACNFMLGFPQETPVELERTLRFMERIAPMVDAFSTMGVVVPFPGTPMYEEYHFAYDFTNWWLRPDYSHYTPPPPLEDADRYYRYYIDDGNLELGFFRYDIATKLSIRECLRFKAEHNLQRMGLMPALGVR
jgi:anaerobic magnesium-protoporphyrin IX monomethyl ester cyclase